ncbi:MAG: sigma-54-dependent transcriptional regulator [Nitrospirota bacterium]
METILVIEDKESMAKMLSQSLTMEGYNVITAADGREGILKVKEKRIDIVITDLKLPKKSGLDVLNFVKRHNSMIPVILITAYGTIETAVKAVKEGAYDFITKPFEPDHLLLIIEKALRTQRVLTENIILKDEVENQLKSSKIIGTSTAIKKTMEHIQKVAQSKATVLLQGESGTGKELFARALHYLSPRKNEAFIAINCAAIPGELLESELFGHEKGAFTGASATKIGKFQLSDKGTIFLDEIGDLDISLQAKMLRVIEGNDIMRIGGTEEIKIDVRVITATNKNLQEEIAKKNFREDLFYRLSVLPIYIPPLRERKEDIPLLVEYFISFYCKELNKNIKTVSDEAMKLMMDYTWTGNIRELQNCIERTVILSNTDVILPEHLGLKLQEEDNIYLRDIPLNGTLHEVSSTATKIAEANLIKRVMKETGGNKTRASEKLEVSYKTLLTKIKEYNIKVEE